MLKTKKNKLNKMKTLMLTCIIGLLFIATSFSGCIESGGATVEKDKVGSGLILYPDGTLDVNPALWGENLEYDGTTVSSIDTVGGGDGYRSDSSIEYVVEHMIHDSMNFANNSMFDALNMIRTSQGRVYTPNGYNLQQAIWDFNNTNGGKIYAPTNYYDFSSNLTIDNHVTIVGNSVSSNRYENDYQKATCINLSGDASIHIIDGKLQNVQVLTEVGWTGDYAVYLDGSAYHWSVSDIYDNLHIRQLGTTHVGTGLGIIAIGKEGNECVAKCFFGIVSVFGFNLGVEIHSDDGTDDAYVNGNFFEKIDVDDCIYGMNITDVDGGESNYNTIFAYDQQPRTVECYGLNIESDGNHFNNIMFWDWHSVSTGIPLTVSGNGNQFSGTLQQQYGFNDTGEGNKLDFKPMEKHVFDIYPTGEGDGTKIYGYISSYDSGEHMKLVFHPGLYDIDNVISRAGRYVDYEIMDGAVLKANVSLSTEMITPLENTKIYGSGTIDMSNITEYAITVSGDNITISGIQMINCSLALISNGAKNGLLVDNVNIHDTYGSGIYLTGGSNITIKDGIISAGDSSSYIIRMVCSNSRIINNYLKGSVSGVYLSSASSTNNLIDGNIISHSTRGIYAQHGNNNTIINNNFFGCSTNGIDDNSDDAIIDNNHFSDCGTNIDVSGATRSIVNGVSSNVGDPGVAGDWASYTRDSVFVWDDSDSEYFQCVNNSWIQFTLT